MSTSGSQSYSNGALAWVLSSALVVTVLFVSFALYFSRSQAADAPSTPTVSQANISNNTPEISADSFVISTVLNPGTLTSDADYDDPSSVIGVQGALTPTASSTLQAYVHILARDSNGWQDLDFTAPDPALVTFDGVFEDNAGPQCVITNNYDCYSYEDVVSNNNCTLVATSTHVVQVRCPVSLSYYTKPSANWTLSLTVFDRAGTNDTQDITVTVNAVLAYSISPTTIDFGSVSIPFSGVTNSNKQVHFANAANTDIVQLEVDHTPMLCAVGATPSGTIPRTDMAYSTSSISSLSDYYEVGAASGTDFGFPIPAQTTTQIQVNTLYNHLVGVPNGTSGSCSGTITFTPSS